MDKKDLNEKLEYYFEVIQKSKTKVGAENAGVIVDQIGKHLRMSEMAANRLWRHNGNDVSSAGQENREDQPATKKQIEFLQDLGEEIPDGLTKGQASEMIEEALSKQ